MMAELRSADYSGQSVCNHDSDRVLVGRYDRRHRTKRRPQSGIVNFISNQIAESDGFQYGRM